MRDLIIKAIELVPEVVPLLSERAREYVNAEYYPPKPAIKSVGDFTAISQTYHDTITRLLIAFFEGGNLVSARNSFKTAMSTAFVDAFETGWIDGGSELPADEAANDWLVSRQDAEFGNISMLFENAKALRKEEDFDYFSWITQRADGYTRTLKEVYNNAMLRAMKDQIVTFTGDDGAESCDTCQKLKGKRHKISWFIARDYVPPYGSSLECHMGGRCQHGLMNDKGEWVTV